MKHNIIDTGEAARILNVSRPTIWRYVQDGDLIPSVVVNSGQSGRSFVFFDRKYVQSKTTDLPYRKRKKATA